MLGKILFGSRLREIEQREHNLRLLEEQLRQERASLDAPVIEFIAEPHDFGVILPPKSASKFVAPWWKKVPVNMTKDQRDNFGAPAMTAKACMPLLDGMTLGYTIPLSGDLHVRASECGKHIKVQSGPFGQTGDLHSVDQLGGKTSPTWPGPAVKFINRWIIKTAPGWSTLFIPPMNHLDDRFTCLAAVVDTDTYDRQINFPAIWHKRGCDEVVDAGTPLITAIPFRRASVPKEFAKPRVMTHEEMVALDLTKRIQDHRRHYYTEELREKR
jgi:hypothetical protein